MSPQPDSRYAVMRLALALVLMTVGASGMYVVAVVLPAVQAEFGVARADASMPYTWMLVGFGLGGILMGRLADRHGVMVPILISAAGLGLGYAAAGLAGDIWLFSAAHGLLIGLLGSSATFAPLIADTALWFARRRGIAVAVCASGNYLAGTVWPPVVQHFVETAGWRDTYLGLGAFSAVVMLSLAPLLRQRPPLPAPVAAAAADAPPSRPFGLSPAVATVLLCVAGLACCATHRRQRPGPTAPAAAAGSAAAAPATA